MTRSSGRIGSRSKPHLLAGVVFALWASGDQSPLILPASVPLDHPVVSTELVNTYIRDILGHVELSTTEIYARASTEAKRKALEAAYQDIVTSDLPEWNQDASLIDWLTNL
jgi:hypothetical protein